MRVKTLIMAIVFCFLAIGLTTGCKKEVTKEQFCEKIQEQVGDEVEITDEICSRAWDEVAEECGDNTQEALSCLMGAEDDDAADECEKICESDEEEEEEEEE